MVSSADTIVFSTGITVSKTENVLIVAVAIPDDRIFGEDKRVAFRIDGGILTNNQTILLIDTSGIS